MRSQPLIRPRLAFQPIVSALFVDGERMAGIARELLRWTDGNRRVRRHARQIHVGGASEVADRAIPARSEPFVV